MAKFSRLYTLTSMIETGLVPVFYNPNPEVAAHIVTACADGGARCIEFTNRGDQAHLVFQVLLQRFQDDERVILGVGSVIDPATAALYIGMGANFVVGPNLNIQVAEVCNRRKIPYSPGCGSVSEISQAESLGVEICKIFPGSQVGGPGFVKSVLAPMPWTRLMPTGGVAPTKDNISAWFDAGVACVGMGSKLVTKQAVDDGDYELITKNVRDVIALIKAIRSGRSPI